MRCHAAPDIPGRRKPTATEDFVRGIWKENPTFVQMLGMCPTMAITNTVKNAIAMGVLTLIVQFGSNVFVSAFRKRIPNEVRISTYILIIATFVQIVDIGAEAMMPDMHKALGAFIPLIVANCLLLGRQEAFSAVNTVYRSGLDGIGMGLGFTLGLCTVATVREILGSGSWLGIRVMPQSFEPWAIMNMPPGGFFAFGLVLLTFAWWKDKKARRAALSTVTAPVPNATLEEVGV
jgi:Na+-translocating ferredoxin:NAD+ oxidoreductase subunit E